MSDLITLFKKDLEIFISKLKEKKIISDSDLKNLNIDYSSKSKQGDLSTNILLILKKKILDSKFDLQDSIIKYFNEIDYISKSQVANAGFLNIHIKKDFLILKLKNLPEDINYYKKQTLIKKKINIEFISANPTGPLHVAHVRGAVLGDVLSSILRSVGHSVTKEYYVNDAGSQIKILGNSLFKRYQELFNINIPMLESEYPGEYLIEIAELIKKNDQDRWLLESDNEKKENYFEVFAVNFLMDQIKKDLLLLNIKFDEFTYESTIVKENYIDKVFDILEKKNLIYDGVLEKPLGDDSEEWEPRSQLLFRSTNFSDDADRSFKKSNGEWTYFANDSAYHYYKYLRGYDKLINIWGADHIGYVSRMKSISDVVSGKKNFLDVCVCQIVRLIKAGQNLKMSKRDGNFITLKQIKNEVGRDALRYFMISSKSETPMDFDMNKVIEKNKDNPVFYCQYAYARASSVLRKAKEFGDIPDLKNSFDILNSELLNHYEWEIILKLLSWPYLLNQTAETKQPHRITNFLEDLSSNFHSLWNRGKDDSTLRFIDDKNIQNSIPKLIWLNTFKIVMKEAFVIIGIDAPESM